MEQTTAVPANERVGEQAVNVESSPEEEPGATGQKPETPTNPRKQLIKGYRRNKPKVPNDSKDSETTSTDSTKPRWRDKISMGAQTARMSAQTAKMGAQTAFRRAREKQSVQQLSSHFQSTPDRNTTQSPTKNIGSGAIPASPSPYHESQRGFQPDTLDSSNSAMVVANGHQPGSIPNSVNITRQPVVQRRQIEYSRTAVVQHTSTVMRNPPPVPPKTPVSNHALHDALPKRAITYPSSVSQDSPQSIASNVAEASFNPSHGYEQKESGFLDFTADTGQKTVDTGRNTADTGHKTADTGHKTADTSHKEPPLEVDLKSQLAVSRIWNILYEFYDDYPAMRGAKGDSVEKAVTELTLTAGENARKLESTEERHRAAQEMANKVRPLELEVKQLENQLRSCRTELQDAKDRLRQMEYTNSEKQTQHQFVVNSLHDDLSRLQAQNRDLQSAYGNWARAQTEIQVLRSERDELQRNLHDRIHEARNEVYQSLSAKHQTALDSRDLILREEQTQHAQDMIKLKEEMSLLKQIAKKDLEEQAYEAALKYKKLVENHETDLDDMEDRLQAANKEIANLQAKLESQKTDLDKRYLAENHQLRVKAEELKMAFAQRQHFKGLRDRDISAKFGRLATEVEDISTMEWDHRRSLSWPFSDDELRRIHHQNTRLLKQQIVQNTLWVLLYRHVFQSPFKIMGGEGLAADSDWLQIYNSENSLQWPEIPESVESARYENARAFLAAVEHPSQAGIDGRRLKESFDSSVSRALGEIRSSLENVSALGASDDKTLESIIRLCAKVWLECCSQRYRLLVRLPAEADDYLACTTKRGAYSLKLVVKPDIKRFGNSQGEDLAMGEAVTGWRGLIQSYPAR